MLKNFCFVIIKLLVQFIKKIKDKKFKEFQKCKVINLKDDKRELIKLKKLV